MVPRVRVVIVWDDDNGEEPHVETFQMINHHQFLPLSDMRYVIYTPFFRDILDSADTLPLHHSLTPVISFLAQVLLAGLV